MARACVPVVGSNNKSVVVSNRNQLPHTYIRSCVWVCANSRARYRRYCFQQRVRYVLKPMTLPNTGLCRGCQCNKARSGSARRVRRHPQIRNLFLCPSVDVAGPLLASLCPYHPAPSLPTLNSFAPCCALSPIRIFVKGGHILVAVRYCMRVSLLLLLLRLATSGTGCALSVMSHVCPGTGTTAVFVSSKRGRFQVIVQVSRLPTTW